VEEVRRLERVVFEVEVAPVVDFRLVGVLSLGDAVRVVVEGEVVEVAVGRRSVIISRSPPADVAARERVVRVVVFDVESRVEVTAALPNREPVGRTRSIRCIRIG